MGNNKPSKRNKQPFIRYPIEDYKAEPDLTKQRVDTQLDRAEYLQERVEYLETVVVPNYPRTIKENKKLSRDNSLLQVELSVNKERASIASRYSLWQVFFTLAGLFLVGYGTDLLVSDASKFYVGIVLVAIGGLISLGSSISSRITGGKNEAR